MKKNFRGVWFRNTVPSKSDWRNRESGELIVDENLIKFISKNTQTTITNIDSISIGLKGSDLINAWIEINYQDIDSRKTIFICDGKFLGYSGILGGTKRIANFISEQYKLNLLVNSNYLKVQFSLLIVFLILLAKLIYF